MNNTKYLRYVFCAMLLGSQQVLPMWPGSLSSFLRRSESEENLQLAEEGIGEAEKKLKLAREAVEREKKENKKKLEKINKRKLNLVSRYERRYNSLGFELEGMLKEEIEPSIAIGGAQRIALKRVLGKDEQVRKFAMKYVKLEKDLQFFLSVAGGFERDAAKQALQAKYDDLRNAEIEFEEKKIDNQALQAKLNDLSKEKVRLKEWFYEEGKLVYGGHIEPEKGKTFWVVREERREQQQRHKLPFSYLEKTIQEHKAKQQTVEEKYKKLKQTIKDKLQRGPQQVVRRIWPVSSRASESEEDLKLAEEGIGKAEKKLKLAREAVKREKKENEKKLGMIKERKLNLFSRYGQRDTRLGYELEGMLKKEIEPSIAIGGAERIALKRVLGKDEQVRKLAMKYVKLEKSLQTLLSVAGGVERDAAKQALQAKYDDLRNAEIEFEEKKIDKQALQAKLNDLRDVEIEFKEKNIDKQALLQAKLNNLSKEKVRLKEWFYEEGKLVYEGAIKPGEEKTFWVVREERREQQQDFAEYTFNYLEKKMQEDKAKQQTVEKGYKKLRQTIKDKLQTKK